MSRLIILSNRVSLPQSEKCVAGGLAVAMQDALSKVGGIWVGWNGEKLNNRPINALIFYTNQKLPISPVR